MTLTFSLYIIALMGLGYTTFNFNFKQTYLGTSYGEEWSQSGPILSAEYTKPFGSDGTKDLAFGGWLSSVGSTTKSGVKYDSITLGEIHARMGFTPNLGLEVGTLLFDADDIGKMLIHGVYQTESKGVKPLKLQAGLGVLTGTSITEGGVNWGKFKTGLSAFANASYPFFESISGYLSIWVLSQKFEWNAATMGAAIPDMTNTTVQWSLGASHSF